LALPPDSYATGVALTTFCRRWIDLSDLAKAIGLGIMRPRDERSAHFRTVPAGCHAKPERLFCLHVTRRKILHEVCGFLVGVDL
jgi:hypothetical protein